MQMMISLYNVLIYLQKPLDILAQTYSLLQRRKTAVQTVLGAVFLGKTGSKMINQLINCEYHLIVRL